MYGMVRSVGGMASRGARREGTFVLLAAYLLEFRLQPAFADRGRVSESFTAGMRDSLAFAA
jgi:hypothetical protein